MTWTNFSFSAGAILTSAQMTNLQANFTAMCSADAGSPIFYMGESTSLSGITDGTALLAVSDIWYFDPGSGIYEVTIDNADSYPTLEIYAQGAWRTAIYGRGINSPTVIFSDGFSNVRLRNSGTIAYNYYWRRLA